MDNEILKRKADIYKWDLEYLAEYVIRLEDREAELVEETRQLSSDRYKFEVLFNRVSRLYIELVVKHEQLKEGI